MPLRVFANIHKKLMIVAATALIAGCDGGFYLSARVVDSEGQAISGAKVLAKGKESTESFDALSDSRGCLSLGSVIAPGEYDFTVSVVAPGYKPLEFASPTLQFHSYQIVLAKPEQAFTGQAQTLEGSQLKDHCGGI